MAKSLKNNTPTSFKNNFKALKYIPRFFSLIWNTNKSMFLANLISRLAKSIIPVLMLWVGKMIIDEVILQVSLENPNLKEIWILLGIEFALAMSSNLLSRAISLTDALLGDLYANKSSVELIDKSAQMELSQLEDPEFYDKLERARRQTTNRVGLMSNVLSQLQDMITVASLITGLIVFEPFLVVLLIIAIIPSFINEIKFSRTSYSLARSWTSERRELDYLRFIGASDVTAKEIKLFGLSDFITQRFSKLAHEYYLVNKLLAIKRTVWGALFNVIGDMAYYSAYVLIIIRVVAGIISVGELTFLAGSFRQLRNQLQSIFSRFSKITESAMYLQDYFDFMDLKTSETGKQDFIPIPKEIKKGFTFENVHFSYNGTQEEVFSNISFELKKGEKLALVGENGAGKTTLIKLLVRLYEPTKGNIYLDGINIKKFRKSEYQKRFGAIFQDYVKYYLSAKENIAIGNIKELENKNKIVVAAENSLADKVIDNLKDRYEQNLGKRFKNGVELSGGQWQKIALARAYMSDSDVIILDEPTSALDARAEYEAFQRFIGLTQGKTSVIISHRFSTVRMADRILVLNKGEILELGTHEELLNHNGLYAELFELQAEGYQ